MVRASPSSPKTCDVLVVGAGLAGAAAALGFARAGFSVVSCGEAERLGQGRTVALLGKSVDLFRELGVWDRIESAAAPMRAPAHRSTTRARSSRRARSNSTPRRSGLRRLAGISKTRSSPIFWPRPSRGSRMSKGSLQGSTASTFAAQRAELTTVDGRTLSAKSGRGRGRARLPDPEGRGNWTANASLRPGRADRPSRAPAAA